MAKITAALAVFLAVPAVASAQDFGTEWLDRVTHERVQERGPLKPRPVDWMGQAGLLGYVDNNVFLADKNGKTPGDVVLVPFARGTMDYAEQRFEADADLMVDYKGYMHNSQADFGQSRAWEERFFGQARYVDARFTLGAAELLRNESDPTDVVLLTRAKRVVSDTTGNATYDLSRTVAVEAHGNYEVVRFYEHALKNIDNDNYRVDVSLVYRQANGYDWLIQAGWVDIFYAHSQLGGAPPDSDGYFVHGGFRGSLMERLSVEALLGWIALQSDRFIGTPNHDSASTIDFTFNLRYEVSEIVRLFGDVSRTMGWAGLTDGSPFQTITRFTAIGEWDALEKLTLRARIQWDHATTDFGIKSDYRSFGITGTYHVSEHLAVDAGITYRTGSTHGNVATSLDFTDAIGHLGLVVTF